MPPVPFLKTALGLLVVFLLALLFVSYSDTQALDEDADIYCANVHDKTWPDFEGSYKKICTPDGKPKP